MNDDELDKIIADVVEKPPRQDRPVEFSQQVMKKIAQEPRSVQEKDVGVIAVLPCLVALVVAAVFVDYLFLGGLTVETEFELLATETFEWPLLEIGLLSFAVPVMYFLLLGENSAEDSA